MDWFRVYHDIIDDPKILALPRAFRWHVIELLAVSSKQSHRGMLPPIKEIGIHLRMSTRKAGEVVSALREAGFIDVNGDGVTLHIHGWEKRQFKSDDVTARTAAHKERSKERSENVPANVLRTETETEQNRTEGEPLPPTLILGTEFTRIGFLAEELGGDPSYAMWVAHSGRLGFPAEWIEAALRRCPKGKLGTDYLSGILRGYQREGGPPKQPSGAAVKTSEPIMDPEKVRKALEACKAAEQQSISEGLARKAARDAASRPK